MKSSTGAHYIALDHVRALAAFMVFAWHFTHGGEGTGHPVPFAYVPAVFPLSVLDEGHTGVALFMALSGYLFAKLLDGKKIHYRGFLWNRALRLFPLLVVAIALEGVRRWAAGGDLWAYAVTITKGAVLPTLPNGAWSITVEIHYYLVLPLFLWMLARAKLLPFAIVGLAVAARAYLEHRTGQAQWWAYWTIVGRVDQFALGMLAFHFRALVATRHLVALTVAANFTAFYSWFDSMGGYVGTAGSPLWVVIPTLEGAAYGTLIAWYDGSFAHQANGLSRVLAKLGEYSYSIYLLHVFVVFHAARLIDAHVMSLSNFYVACAWALVCFVAMLVPGYVSFRFIEAPFLRFRKRYLAGPAVYAPAAVRTEVAR